MSKAKLKTPNLKNPIRKVSDITPDNVRLTVENIINRGRLADKKQLITISKHTEPAALFSKLTTRDKKYLNVCGKYSGLSANDYDTEMSMLWTTLNYTLGEDILQVANYVSPFASFYSPLDIGAHVREFAPRVKEGLDRKTLPNSALLSNYVTTYDSFFYGINQFKVFASTYERTEIAKISNTWNTISTMLNAEIQNLLLSANDYLHQLSKDAMISQFMAGGMDSVTIPMPIDKDRASMAAIGMLDAMDDMVLELNTKYIPYNLNSDNPDPTIKDIAISTPVFVASSHLLNSVHFLTALNTYFGKEWRNDRFADNVIKIPEFVNTINPAIQITPGYTARTDNPNILGFIVERDAFRFKKNEIGTFNFDNAATLNTSVFHHLECFANISDRRKSVALIAGN